MAWSRSRAPGHGGPWIVHRLLTPALATRGRHLHSVAGMNSRRIGTKLALGAGARAGRCGHRARRDHDTEPSTTTDPYLKPVADAVRITSLLTVSDRKSASD